VVWATRDPKFGGGASLARLFDLPGANHRIAWREGLLAEESRALLLGFFRAKRRPQP
jgi:tRNA(Arg) A34 adenosine deaminase TadA